MTRSFAAAMRRANRMMRPARMAKATRSMQSAMTGLMVKTALSPIAALTPKKSKARKRAVAKPDHPLTTVMAQMRAAQALVPGIVRPPRRAAVPRIPAGAQYLARNHRSSAGSRGYKIYLPASRPKRPAGLILMLHGCNQTPDDFAAGTHMNVLAEKHGLAIAYPAQRGGHNAASCWNWFSPANQKRGAGEPSILASLARKLSKELGLGRECVFVAGLSAGGAMAVILADVYPDVFSAAGVHSGLARGAAHDVMSAMSAMRRGGATTETDDAPTRQTKTVRWIIFQGDADTTVHPSNADMIVAAAVGGGAVPVSIGNRSAGGRGYVRRNYAGSDGATVMEYWAIEGAGHAWSGGRAAGSYTDRQGPDASAQMIRFFLAKSAHG